MGKWTPERAEAVMDEEAVRKEFYTYFDSDQMDIKGGTASTVAVASESGMELSDEWFGEMLKENFWKELQDAKDKIEKRLGLEEDELTDGEFLDIVQVSGIVSVGSGGYMTAGAPSGMVPARAIVIAKGVDETEVELDLSWAVDDDPEFLAAAEEADLVSDSYGTPYSHVIVSVYWTVYVDPQLVEEYYG